MFILEDVIIAPNERTLGTAHFFHNWAKAVWEYCDWWCALASGPRTFRIPFTFFERVTPNEQNNETICENKLRHRLAQAVYDDDYCSRSGIVTLKHAYQLRSSTNDAREDYPMWRYFNAVNPGWQRGDEMVSLISLQPSNWKPIALRMLRWKGDHV